jgi:fermentation-respiration switch protein FrsA (DUF1100 family)
VLWFLHWLLLAVYFLAPPFVVFRAFCASRAGRRTRQSWVPVTILWGSLIGVIIALTYQAGIGGTVPLWQFVLSAYFSTSLLLLVRGVDRVIRSLLGKGIRKALDSPSRLIRSVLPPVLAVLRGVILAAVAIPLSMAAVMTWRIKSVPDDNPMSQLGFRYENVAFLSRSGGGSLSGWWIPALDNSRCNFPPGTRTVILCHGLGGGRSHMVTVSSEFVPRGYNVLVFDFRAHGGSFGQISTFGSRESEDVLGAVRYLREHRPAESERIYGLGASMGAAALVGAAGELSQQLGSEFAGVALVGTYDSLPELAQSVARTHFVRPFDLVVRHVVLPLASIHAGVDLSAFRPADRIEHVWPTPVLVVHGEVDQIIDFRHGKRLFEHAVQPKHRVWVQDAGHNEPLNDPGVLRAIRLFFDQAGPATII